MAKLFQFFLFQNYGFVERRKELSILLNILIFALQMMEDILSMLFEYKKYIKKKVCCVFT